VHDHPFSPPRLARMHEALRRHVESGLLPGLVALVHHRGREHVEAIGAQAFGSNAPMRRDTIFRLASMTKPVTDVAATILVEECKLRLDDPVEEWLPEVKDRRRGRAGLKRSRISLPLSPVARGCDIQSNRFLTIVPMVASVARRGFLSPRSKVVSACQIGARVTAWWLEETVQSFHASDIIRLAARRTT
jgi:hypothetical protein